MAIINKQYIYEHLQKQMDYIIAQGYDYNNVIGIFLYGSQNYGLADNTSDIDSKVIILPTFEDICLNTLPISKEYCYEDNEKIDVKDIRLYKEMLIKQNTNYIETLFTEYYILNPKYEELFIKYFINNKENIAHYNRKSTVMSIRGQIFNNFKHSTSTQKQLYNVIRLYCFLEDYLKNIPYSKCLHPTGIKYIYLLQLKHGSLDAETIHSYMVDLEQKTDTLIEQYDYVSSKENKVAAATLDNGVIEIFKLGFYDEGVTCISKQDFFNKLTTKEKEAYNYMVSSMKDDNDYIIISQLVKKSHLSRSVFDNLLKKMKDNHVATIENAGVKGLNVSIIQHDMKLDAQKWSTNYVI